MRASATFTAAPSAGGHSPSTRRPWALGRDEDQVLGRVGRERFVSRQEPVLLQSLDGFRDLGLSEFGDTGETFGAAVGQISGPIVSVLQRPSKDWQFEFFPREAPCLVPRG